MGPTGAMVGIPISSGERSRADRAPGRRRWLRPWTRSAGDGAIGSCVTDRARRGHGHRPAPDDGRRIHRGRAARPAEVGQGRRACRDRERAPRSAAWPTSVASSPTRARAQADAAADALRVAQRTYDAHDGRAGGGRGDRRSARCPRGEGGGAGRLPGRRQRGDDPRALEAAARDWLTEINRINNEARDAMATATRANAAAAAIGATLERLSLEADAARIAPRTPTPPASRRERPSPNATSGRRTDPAAFLIPPGDDGHRAARTRGGRDPRAWPWRPAARRGSSGCCAAIGRR